MKNRNIPLTTPPNTTSPFKVDSEQTGYGHQFVFTLFTNDLELARAADHAGVNRIGLDLEYVGKHERQAGLGSWISDHDRSQVPALCESLSRAKSFARVNPIFYGSKQEIDELIDAGIQVLMLPMFTTVREAAIFAEMVDGRAETSLLVETAAAAMRIHDIVKIEGIDEIHVGLNDLHRSAGLNSHWEVLVSDVLDTLSGVVTTAGLPFGFGGVGRVNDTTLPIPADLIYAQYPRLRATRALISRVFVKEGLTADEFRAEMVLCRERLDYWQQQTNQQLLQQHVKMRELVAQRFSEQ